ncbi:exosortase A [Sphingomonas cannabina]|uniref:exosortase A n=1 Tax=Sphingomonas cannabina TaxID=2899123 RepID=UPI0029E8049A|nr:exosortase A [Sphingomonas cannabina]
MTLVYPRSAFAAAMPAAWRTPLVLLAGAWAALLILFHSDVADLAGIYWNSTTFGHCLFVPPVIAWLVWQRRRELALLKPEAWWGGQAIVVAGAVAWFLGDAAGVAFARHLGLIVMMQGAVVAILGWGIARGLLFPLAYMMFLVPFGEALESPLQTVTVAITMPLLHLFAVPASVDGVLITIPNGYFEVAEACSGAKFVIAMVAYGALVANVCYVSWRRRIAFFAMALVVPVIANGLRAFGTIYAAHLTSMEAATGFDHIVYGWVFFGLVMAAVLAIGWRWFDRDPDASWFDPAKLAGPARGQSDPWTAAGAAIALATLAYAGGAVVVGRSDALPAQLALPEVPGWHRVPLSTAAPWTPYYPTADHGLIGRYQDAAGHRVDLAVVVYAGQREGHELVSFGQGVLRENDRWVRIEDLPALAGGSVQRITAPGPVEREVATWYRVAGMTTSDPGQVKLATLKAKLLGGPQCAVAIHLSAERADGDARAAMAAFLAAAGPVDRLADRIAAGR